MRAVTIAVIAAILQLPGVAPLQAQQGRDEDMAWVTDQDEEFFYLAYSVPESDRFGIAFVCAPEDRSTYVVLRETEGMGVKGGDKFPLSLQIGDVKTVVPAETSFDSGEDMLRSVAPIKSDDAIFAALLNGSDPLQVTRMDKTFTFPLTEISGRLQEFQRGCGLTGHKKRR